MKAFFRTTLTALCLAVMLTAAPVLAAAAETDPGQPASAAFQYREQDDGSVVITRYLGEASGVTIPDTLSGKPVAALGEWAFANNIFVESVTGPAVLTQIPTGAFYNCPRLRSVSMGNVTAIGDSAFEKCLFLEEVPLGNQLKTIGNETFFDCRRLSKLDIPDTVTAIGEEAFTNCRSLTKLVLPEGITKIGSEDIVGFGMFENCKSLEEVTIPSGVGYIQPNAFEGCKNVLLLGENESYAQEYALFHELPFKAIVVPDEMVGDVSGDARVDVTDATLIQMNAAEVIELTGRQQRAADVNHDGKIDVTDATTIQLYAAELIDDLP